MDFVSFSKLPKNNKLLKKFILPDKRGFELKEKKKKRIPAPPANPHL